MKVVLGGLLSDIAKASELNFELDKPLKIKEFFEDSLFRQHPGLRLRIVTEKGEPRKHVAIFIGETHLALKNYEEAILEKGNDVYIFPAVSGG